MVEGAEAAQRYFGSDRRGKLHDGSLSERSESVNLIAVARRDGVSRSNISVMQALSPELV